MKFAGNIFIILLVERNVIEASNSPTFDVAYKCVCVCVCERLVYSLRILGKILWLFSKRIAMTGISNMLSST